MLSSIAPRHAPSTSLQKAPTSTHNRAPPKPIISLHPRARQASNVAVHIDRLPIALGHMVDLVPDAHVRPLLVIRIPPLPALHVVVRMRESVQAFDSLEVADVHELALRLAVGSVGPGRHAQEAEFFIVAFKVDDHLREELADLLDAGGEDAEGVVVAEADVEDGDAGVGGLVAVVA